MFALDALDFIRTGRNETHALGVFRDIHERRPADATAPHRRRVAVNHQRRTVAGFFEQSRIKILFDVEAEAIKHITRQHDKTRTRCTPHHGLADQVADALVRTVGAHHEHARL